MESKTVKIDVRPNGPLLCHGEVEVQKGDGSIEMKQNVTAFCRCGGSANKPYCDGNHAKLGFIG
ncbi:MAG: CDGSH-type Zn-finger protein [Bacteroidia bacterium]|jgi:CDGSH-type Zn-finger protein